MHAIGGNKRVLYAAGRGTRVNTTALAARECRGYYVAGPFDIRTGCTPELFFELIPHWSPMAFAETAPAPRALQVDWTRAGGSVRIPVTPASGHGDALDFRIAGEPGAAPVDIDVRVRDTSGAWMSLGSGPMTLRSYHGLAPLGKVVARQLACATSRTGREPHYRHRTHSAHGSRTLLVARRVDPGRRARGERAR